jgi:FkbM family methyltransferase
MIDEIQFSDNDCVIDCGANVGEVSLWLKRRIPRLRHIRVEPEPKEAKCADLKVFDGKVRTVRRALWKEEGTLSFYKKPESADSSLFEVEDMDEVVQVPVTTLANLLGEMEIERVRLLKLEAEGAEPEILLGCGQYLSRIDYIAADCGPERGLSQDETATDLINFLVARNFNLMDMKFDRVVCLFRNRSAKF